MTARATPFDDLDDFLALPRVSGLTVSPNGSRAVVAVAELNAKRTAFVTALWELDVAGERPARRLTRGAKGEASPAFTAAGDLLFVATREVPGTEGDPKPSLWRLPAAGGEAESILELPGGVDAVHTARAADLVLVTASLMPSATGITDDERVRALRKDNEISAVLHTGYPVRYWDEDIGPAQTHLVDVAGPRDLTAHPGQALREGGVAVSADGRFLVASWAVSGTGASLRQTLVRIDVATGERSTIADDPDADLGSPTISPDGSRVAFVREAHSTPELAPRIGLSCLRFGESARDVAVDWDRWPTSVAWTTDGSALVVTADDNGRGPIFVVDPDDSSVTRLTDDDFSYGNVCTASDGVVYALRSSYSAQPHPVRIDRDGSITELPSVDMPALPGRLTEVTAAADDGTPVRSWLILPEGEKPAPLVLWIHGGPLASWNTWHWRWNPWLLAARGYAVLMPDPALSTGYGQEFIQRGWGAWGFAPYTDLMAATDAGLRHPGVDETRTAAMGGSFGGYMANWIAGHTDRFDAIVTHASLWALDQFGPTTDGGYWWAREMTAEMAERNSPHRSVGDITTPMLVIHGDKDYRVPIGEGLRLWFDLLARSGRPAADDGSGPHQFLYFPTEGHWVLAPQHAKVWYQVVLGFLGRHLLGEDAEVPETLG